MKLVSAKKSSEVKLNGINVELTIVDGAIKGVTFADADGSIVKCEVDTYSFKILVPAPTEYVKKYRLLGTFCDVVVDKVFSDKWGADQDKRLMEENSMFGKTALEIEEIDVPVVD